MVIASLFGGSSTKEKIIEILSKEWPLSAKKIYNQLLKDHKLSITYQATHKALKELLESKVLEKRKEGYLLNKEWADKLENFSEKIKDELEQRNENKEIKTIQKLTFNNHLEFLKFHLDFMEEVVKKDKKLEMVFHYRQAPYPHVLSNEQITKMKRIMPKINWTIIVKKDNPMGKWGAKQWKQMGVNVIFDPNISDDRMMLLNDYILNVHTSKASLKAWDDSYDVKDVNDFNVNSTIEDISDSKYKTIVTIMKDKELANMLK